MKVIMDRDKRRGPSHCASTAPDVFELDAHFKSLILNPHGHDDAAILRAAQACPKPAILGENAPRGARIFPGPIDKPRDQLDIWS
jgi:ferredoxin